MNAAPLGVAFLFLVLTGPRSVADEPSPFPDLPSAGNVATAHSAPAPPWEHGRNLFEDFRHRLEAAIETHDPVAFRALYQTNAVTAAQLDEELALWRPVINGNAKGKGSVTMASKDLSMLPPTSHRFWEDKAHRVSTHPISHFTMVSLAQTPPFHRILPLIEIDGKLLIVVSDKSRNG